MSPRVVAPRRLDKGKGKAPRPETAALTVDILGIHGLLAILFVLVGGRAGAIGPVVLGVDDFVALGVGSLACCSSLAVSAGQL